MNKDRYARPNNGRPKRFKERVTFNFPMEAETKERLQRVHNVNDLFNKWVIETIAFEEAQKEMSVVFNLLDEKS